MTSVSASTSSAFSRASRASSMCAGLPHCDSGVTSCAVCRPASASRSSTPALTAASSEQRKTPVHPKALQKATTSSTTCSGEIRLYGHCSSLSVSRTCTASHWGSSGSMADEGAAAWSVGAAAPICSTMSVSARSCRCPRTRSHLLTAALPEMAACSSSGPPRNASLSVYLSAPIR
eukprot:5798509-Prymnesium_polylepis.1